MIDRRELMASGIAATLLSRLAVASAPDHLRNARSVFVCDERIPEARQAAREAMTLGATVLGLSADVTAVYEWLDLNLRHTPIAVAGLTSPNALFVIERLAWDRGLRTVYRGVHRRVFGRLSSQMLVGSPDITTAVGSIGSGNVGRNLGRVLAAATPNRADRDHLVTSQLVPRRNETALVSWLLAPRDLLRTQSLI